MWQDGKGRENKAAFLRGLRTHDKAKAERAVETQKLGLNPGLITTYWLWDPRWVP